MINLFDISRIPRLADQPDLRSTESHTPEDRLLVNEESFPNRVRMLLLVGLGSCRQAFDIDRIPV